MRYLSFLFLLGFSILFSCNKDQSPVLEIQTLRQDLTPATSSFIVITTGSPTNPFPSQGSGNIDTVGFHKKGITDGTGKIKFEFPYSAVLTVEARYLYLDTFARPPKMDTLLQKKVIRLETKYQSKENLVQERIIFDK